MMREEICILSYRFNVELWTDELKIGENVPRNNIQLMA